MSRRYSKITHPLSKPAKPDKPRPDFPLFPHNNGTWAKKIRGKLHYFGPWHDPEGALAKYLTEKDDLHAGRLPRVSPGVVTVKDVANSFLRTKKARVESGELTLRTWTYYKDVVDIVVAHMGKARLVSDLRPDDFESLRVAIGRRWGVSRLGNAVQYARCLFKHAYDAGLIPVPVRFGADFRRPSKKVMRLHRAQCGAKLFTVREMRALIDGAIVVGKDGPELVRPGAALRAIFLLGINCGFGNMDCGTLPLSAVKLNDGMIDFPRPKTGIARRCPLWPETVTALQDALAERPEPKDVAHVGLVFITKYGLPWAKNVADSPVTKETRKLLDRLGIGGHRNFYAIRHTFRTVADEAKDQPAADHLMGHESPHMSTVYRERISDERLRAVTDHVRKWLYPETTVQ